MEYPRTARPVAVLCFLTLLALPLTAQEEPLLDQLTSSFKKEYFSVGVLLQAVGDFQVERSFPGRNGFNISNMRINISGNLDGGFSYRFKTNLVRSPAILDAVMSYAAFPALAVDAGLFKAPFSAEFLTSAGAIDFVNRAQVVSALAPNRQIGVQLRGRPGGGPVSYAAGVFNGNRFGPNVNDDDRFLYVGRLSIAPSFGAENGSGPKLEIGLNAGGGKDADAPIGNLLPSFRGTRTLAGGDVRLTYREFLFAGEVIAARLRTDSTGTATPKGYHATAGYLLTKDAQVLLRWDSFVPDGLAPDSHLLILGCNIWPTRATELQVNYIVPTTQGGPRRHQLLVNAQLSF